MTNGGDGDEVLTLWDRRMVQAIETSQAARKGVAMLRILALLIAGISVVGSALLTLGLRDTIFDSDTGMRTSSLPDRYEWGQFLSSIAGPLAMAGLLLAASYLLSVYTARLDMDIILADNEEVARMERDDDPDDDSTFTP